MPKDRWDIEDNVQSGDLVAPTGLGQYELQPGQYAISDVTYEDMKHCPECGEEMLLAGEIDDWADICINLDCPGRRRQ